MAPPFWLPGAAASPVACQVSNGPGGKRWQAEFGDHPWHCQLQPFAALFGNGQKELRCLWFFNFNFGSPLLELASLRGCLRSIQVLLRKVVGSAGSGVPLDKGMGFCCFQGFEVWVFFYESGNVVPKYGVSVCCCSLQPIKSHCLCRADIFYVSFTLSCEECLYDSPSGSKIGVALRGEHSWENSDPRGLFQPKPFYDSMEKRVCPQSELFTLRMQSGLSLSYLYELSERLLQLVNLKNSKALSSSSSLSCVCVCFDARCLTCLFLFPEEERHGCEPSVRMMVSSSS